MMRRILTALVLVGLLLNMEPIWGVCGNCCVARIHACSAASIAMPHCHGDGHKHSSVISKNKCLCDLPNASSVLTVSQFDQERLTQRKDLPLRAVQALSARAILEIARTRPSPIWPDSPILAAASSSLVPLRI